VRDAKPPKCIVDQFGLRSWRPNHFSGAITVAKTGTVENDDPMVLGGQIDQSARLEILDHAPVAMKKDQWFASSTLDVVQPNTVYLQELTLRGVVAHSLLSEMSVRQGR
jgi:hypothetical protein